MTHQQTDRVSVYVIEARVWGELLHPGAHTSLVRYSEGGIEYTVYLENDEFIERDVEKE
jgi:hypothetical protein